MICFFWFLTFWINLGMCAGPFMVRRVVLQITAERKVELVGPMKKAPDVDPRRILFGK